MDEDTKVTLVDLVQFHRDHTEAFTEQGGSAELVIAALLIHLCEMSNLEHSDKLVVEYAAAWTESSDEFIAQVTELKRKKAEV